MIFFFVLVIVFVSLILFLRKFNNNKNIYIDTEHNRKVFRSERYRLVAKPDKLKQAAAKVDVHEFKGRKGKIYKSDVVQALAASLAVNDTFEVRSVVVENSSGSKETINFTTHEKIFKRIKQYYDIAKEIKSGSYKIGLAYPERNKCKSCSYRSKCAYRY